MALQLRRMDAPHGVEAIGIDLSQPLDDALFREVEDAFNTHSVLLFRDQDLTVEQQLDFSRRFGALELHVLDHYVHKSFPEVLIVSNVKQEGRHVGIPNAGRYWHTDLSYMQAPSRGSALYAIEIPEKNGEPLGDTLFASATAAYDALSAEMKARVDGLEGVFSLAHRFARLAADGDDDAMSEEQQAKAPEVVHRIVQTHPVTGRRILFVNEGHTARLLGLPEEEGRALLAELCAHCTKPEFVYRHRWRAGDLLMWDNLPTQHLAVNDYALPQRRYLHRTTLTGPPIA